MKGAVLGERRLLLAYLVPGQYKTLSARHRHLSSRSAKMRRRCRRSPSLPPSPPGPRPFVASAVETVCPLVKMSLASSVVAVVPVYRLPRFENEDDDPVRCEEDVKYELDEWEENSEDRERNDHDPLRPEDLLLRFFSVPMPGRECSLLFLLLYGSCSCSLLCDLCNLRVRLEDLDGIGDGTADGNDAPGAAGAAAAAPAGARSPAIGDTGRMSRVECRWTRKRRGGELVRRCLSRKMKEVMILMMLMLMEPFFFFFFFLGNGTYSFMFSAIFSSTRG